jgi:hypothetical protein
MITKTEIDTHLARIRQLAQRSSLCSTFYIRLGEIVVKIENYVPELDFHIRTQFAYIIDNKLDKCDFKFAVWKYNNDNADEIRCGYQENANSPLSFINIWTDKNEIWAYDADIKTYYFSAKDFSEDAIRQMGHLLVRKIYKLALRRNQTLVHCAAIGFRNHGILFCARGGGGKSTLTVAAMLGGFQYVSDDYLILSQDENKIYAHPIYSTVNLTPNMLLEQMPNFKGTKLWQSWWMSHKNTYEISAHHDSFVQKMPINIALFPKICGDITPFVEPMDKGKAIVQMVHSTNKQMTGDLQNPQLTKKLIGMIKDLDFYQINLCGDLNKNVETLKIFLNQL